MNLPQLHDERARLQRMLDTARENQAANQLSEDILDGVIRRVTVQIRDIDAEIEKRRG